MSVRVETRRVLRCDWCGWEVGSLAIRTDEDLRIAAAKQDGWRVINGEDVCGDLHAREKGAGT